MTFDHAKARKGFVRSFVLGVALTGLMAPYQAQAMLMLQISDGSSTVTLTDNGSLVLDQSPAPGLVAYSFVSPTPASTAWDIVFASGSSKPYEGTAAHPDMHFSFVASGGPGTLTFALTDTNFFSSQPIHYTFSGQMDLATNATGTINAYRDNTNTPFALTTLLGSCSNVSCVQSSSGFPAGGPYALTIAGTLVHTGQGSSSFDSSLRVTPLPASLWLFGTGVAGLGLWRRVRANA